MVIVISKPLVEVYNNPGPNVNNNNNVIDNIVNDLVMVISEVYNNQIMF